MTNKSKVTTSNTISLATGLGSIAQLYNTLEGLHSFFCISNLAYQTTRKLYPLITLSFTHELIQGAIRLGLLVIYYKNKCNAATWALGLQRGALQALMDTKEENTLNPCHIPA